MAWHGLPFLGDVAAELVPLLKNNSLSFGCCLAVFGSYHRKKHFYYSDLSKAGFDVYNSSGDLHPSGIAAHLLRPAHDPNWNVRRACEQWYVDQPKNQVQTSLIHKPSRRRDSSSCEAQRPKNNLSMGGKRRSRW